MVHHAGGLVNALRGFASSQGMHLDTVSTERGSVGPGVPMRISRIPMPSCDPALPRSVLTVSNSETHTFRQSSVQDSLRLQVMFSSPEN